MSDEFKNSHQDESPLEDNSITETSSTVEDPVILESLKNLSLSEKMASTEIVHTPDSIKNIVEAAILAANKAITLDKILTLFPEGEKVDKNSLRQAIDGLMEDYQARGVELVEVSSGFRFQVAQTVAPWVSRLWEEKPQKYSRALLETLALVAYRQPITRGEIEAIRGVSVSSQIMRTLVDREWVRVIGHRDVPGKPAMYASTKQFLDYFGLKRLDELPTLAEIRDLDTINAELDFGNAQGDAESNEVIGSPDKSGNNELSNSPDKEISVLDSNDTDKRIDIDVELDALKETYSHIDSIETITDKVGETEQETNFLEKTKEVVTESIESEKQINE